MVRFHADAPLSFNGLRSYPAAYQPFDQMLFHVRQSHDEGTISVLDGRKVYLGLTMQSPQEFMESYLREGAELSKMQFRQSLPFHEKHYSEIFLKAYYEFHASESQNPEALVSVEVAGESATAITNKSLWESKERNRYHLVFSGQSWKISGVDWTCYVCKGTGRDGEAVCEFCHGEGWQPGK
jgi:hypothetical protein